MMDDQDDSANHLYVNAQTAARKYENVQIQQTDNVRLITAITLSLLVAEIITSANGDTYDCVRLFIYLFECKQNYIKEVIGGFFLKIFRER